MSQLRPQFSRFFNRFATIAGLLILIGSSSLSADTPQRILFFGDSLTAGYGIDPAQAYPALIQNKIDQHGLNAKVLAGAVSGDTSAGGGSASGGSVGLPARAGPSYVDPYKHIGYLGGCPIG